MWKRGVYPTNLIFSTVLQADEGPENTENGVIRSTPNLRKMLPHQATLLKSSVNFDKEQLIFVALGRRDAGGHEAQINAVSYLTDRENGLPSLTEVSYRENFSPELAAEMQSGPTFPIHVIKLQKLDGKTVFHKS
jgi:hypothetical protein